MRVDLREVEFSCDKEEHSAHGCEPGVSAGFAFGGLEESVECLDVAFGLPGLGPCDDAVEVFADHPGNSLHWFDFGAHDVGAPVPEQGRDDVDLPALEDFRAGSHDRAMPAPSAWWRPGRSGCQDRRGLHRRDSRGP